MSQSISQPRSLPAPKVTGFILAATLLLFSSGFLSEGRAQIIPEDSAKKTAEAAVRQDSSKVVLRLADAADFAHFISDPDFDYERDQGRANTIWQKLYVWLFGSLFKALAASPMRPVWRILPYLIMGAALYLLVSRLLKSQVQGIFSRADAGAALEFNETREDINRGDFKERIEIAIREKKYRQAIRLLYLSSLRQLAQAGAIRWHLDKTNHDYLTELAASPARQPFAELTRLFEYIWYGEFALNQAAFDAAHHRFRQFEKLVAQDGHDLVTGRK